MNPKERAIAALELKQPDDIVPTFELEFQLTREFFDKDFKNLRDLSGKELDLGIGYNAEFFVQIAEGLDYSTIRTGDTRILRKLVEMGANKTYLLCGEADGTMSIPSGDNMVALATRLFEEADEVKKGLDAAWKQGVMGGAIGGLSAGISGAANGRKFWTGDAKGSMYVSAERLSINVPEQRAELNMEGMRSEINPYYVNSDLTYDGYNLNWHDNFSDGSSRLRYQFAARSGGRSQLPANVKWGITPNGDYVVNNLRLRELNQETIGFFTNDGFGFTVDLVKQFDHTRDLFRIYFDNTCSWGTSRCIGIIDPNDAHIFYNSIQKYFSRNSSNIGLWVNQ